jgi:hypothetical protein
VTTQQQDADGHQEDRDEEGPEAVTFHGSLPRDGLTVRLAATAVYVSFCDQTTQGPRDP